MNRVIFGVDGFMNDQDMGYQVRLFCFGLNIAVYWGDKDPDGNGYHIYFGLQETHKVI